MSKIVIAGANGYLGQLLGKAFHDRGDQVILLVRNIPANIAYGEYVLWDGKTAGEWIEKLERAEVLINLAGKSVDCRYSEANKQAILASRLDSTRILAKAIADCKIPPARWLNASSATTYRHAEDRDMDEMTGEMGTGFSVSVCQQWEQALFQAVTPQTLKVAMRIGIVLGANGGALQPLRSLVKWGLGGRLGTGRQYMSWISELDFVRAVMFLADQPLANNCYNVTSPGPVTNREFMAMLRAKWKRPVGVPLPKWLLEVGALLIRTETELVLKSRRVVPARLQAEGFHFHQPTLNTFLQLEKNES